MRPGAGRRKAWWHEATEDLAEGTVAQLISLAMVALPSVWLIGAFWNDRRATYVAGETRT
jgi:high-affinity iron transporter